MRLRVLDFDLRDGRIRFELSDPPSEEEHTAILFAAGQQGLLEVEIKPPLREVAEKPVLIGGVRAAHNWCRENGNLNPRDVIRVHSVWHLRGHPGPINPIWLHDATDLSDYADIEMEIQIINARHREPDPK